MYNGHGGGGGEVGVEGVERWGWGGGEVGVKGDRVRGRGGSVTYHWVDRYMLVLHAIPSADCFQCHT